MSLPKGKACARAFVGRAQLTIPELNISAKTANSNLDYLDISYTFFLAFFLYPCPISTSYTLILLFIFSYHMIEGMSQQKGYRFKLSNARYGTQAQSHCGGVGRTQLTIEEHCRALHYCLDSVAQFGRYAITMFFNLF